MQINVSVHVHTTSLHLSEFVGLENNNNSWLIGGLLGFANSVGSKWRYAAGSPEHGLLQNI